MEKFDVCHWLNCGNELYLVTMFSIKNMLTLNALCLCLCSAQQTWLAIVHLTQLNLCLMDFVPILLTVDKILNQIKSKISSQPKMEESMTQETT